MAEGYVTRLALDDNDEVIGYEFVHLGRMMEMIHKGTDVYAIVKGIQPILSGKILLRRFRWRNRTYPAPGQHGSRTSFIRND